MSEREFRFPHEWTMTFDVTLKVQEMYAKNVYGGYLKSVWPRSRGEVTFERWCEASVRVVVRQATNDDGGMTAFPPPHCQMAISRQFGRHPRLIDYAA